jgi:RNA recognition motif-containing protein|tara:strand:+ start:1854 stop:2141 length:288 start_codon:yes stop_codon:yes gene_type:complete
VYVKNLAEDVDETSLKRMFNKFGVVESCCVIRDVSTNASRGFGFVKFQNVHQARHAIGSTHGLSVRGRSLEGAGLSQSPRSAVRDCAYETEVYYW